MLKKNEKWTQLLSLGKKKELNWIKILENVCFNFISFVNYTAFATSLIIGQDVVFNILYCSCLRGKLLLKYALLCNSTCVVMEIVGILADLFMHVCVSPVFLEV